MGIIVQKFGGSSVATTEHIAAVADRIVRARRDGHDIVVTVSAMGDTTSELLEDAGAVSRSPAPRELDALLSTGERISSALLSMALIQRGVPAVSLDGGQAGLHTDGNHFNAAVESVDPARIRAELDAGRVPVVTGYQGRAPSGETTTLGLGGSDTTAVVLAGALDAERCDICTDIDGVYSADPRVVPDAYRIDELGYTEMAELARHGAGVLNPRSVEHARRDGVRLHVCSTFEPEQPGTLIHDTRSDGAPRAVGVASHEEVLPVRVECAEGRARAIGDRILDSLGQTDILLDRLSTDGARREILIPGDGIADRAAFREHVASEYGDRATVARRHGSVSAVGRDVGRDADVAAESRRDAERARIPLYAHYRDDHAITCVLSTRAVPEAMRLLHERLEPTDAAA